LAVPRRARREAKDWCAQHHPGSPIKEIGADVRAKGTPRKTKPRS
jgi:hypothetical protein